MGRTLHPAPLLLLAASAVLAAPAAFAEAGLKSPPGREILPPREQVWETFLGYVVGLIRTDTAARAEFSYLLEILPELDVKETYRRISYVEWGDSRLAGARALTFGFDGDLEYPIPLSILGYHPGSISASAVIGLREIGRGIGGRILAGPYHLFVVERGYARIVFDAWLDALAGSLLDTFTLEALALLTYQGELHALLVGRGVRGQSVPWAVNLARNKVKFPVPNEFRTVADQLLLSGNGAGALLEAGVP